METMTAENNETFLLGDFNVDLLKIDNSIQFNLFS